MRSAAGSRNDPSTQAVVARVLELVPDGARVGLGSGRAVSEFVVRLGALRGEGLRVSVMATSNASQRLASRVGIPVIPLG